MLPLPGERVAQMGWRCSPPDSVPRLTGYRAAQEEGLGQERVGVWSGMWHSHCSPQWRAQSVALGEAGCSEEGACIGADAEVPVRS